MTAATTTKAQLEARVADLEEQLSRQREKEQGLRRYLALPKFSWPEDWVNVKDVLARLDDRAF